ncbi:MAG: lipopolysaccharide transport periplasmic protein LptA [Aquificae bacterium]|nr:lipopolysaccharide transport periplasmic protein LptA [Aquificota bacterium]
MVKNLLTLLSVLILVYISHPEQNKEPLIIEAEEFIFTGEENVAIYKGNVKVKKGKFKLTAEEIKVFLSKNGELKKLIAKGNVEFKLSQDIWGKAEHVSIDNIKQKAVLKGNAELHHKNTILSGEEIIFYMKENRVLVYGGKGKKVRTIIIPSK